MADIQTLKKKLHAACLKQTEEKRQTCLQALRAVQESLSSETKSTAGDKHETGRAMIQLERERLGAQLAKIEEELTELHKIDPTEICDRVRQGAVVMTSGMNYFVGLSIGALKVDGIDFFAISLQSPIGMELNGKTKGSKINFRGRDFEILEIG